MRFLVDGKKRINDFNERLNERLDDANFQISPDGDGMAARLGDIDDDVSNRGVVANPGVKPDTSEYGDMISRRTPGGRLTKRQRTNI